VERKTTAYFLSELLGRLETLRFLQVGVQTGYAVNDLATSARQRAVLDAFREGTLNCLVSLTLNPNPIAFSCTCSSFDKTLTLTLALTPLPFRSRARLLTRP